MTDSLDRIMNNLLPDRIAELATAATGLTRSYCSATKLKARAF
jgi:hypothetical protein